MFNQNFKGCIKKTFDKIGNLIVGYSGVRFCCVVSNAMSNSELKNLLDDADFVRSISLASVGLSMKILSNSCE